jgi:ABC-type multidrug transport system ATPase subunit
MTVEPGHIISLLGANGAGKTTLLRCLSSIVVPDKGTILFDGELFRRGRLDLRRRLSFLPDFPVMYGHMKPLQHIAMVLRLYEKESNVTSERAIDVLNSLDLLPFVDTLIQRLSRGQIYKTALAAVILADPEVWLLDEPLASGMDPAGIAGLKKECRAAAARGRIVIYSTQLLDIAETFSDRVCVLNRGKLELFEEVSAIQARAAKPEGALEELFLKLRSGA